jgi:hypothetical protein
MQTGWIKLHRSILEWEWYTDTNVTRLFYHLILTVNYEPKKWRGIAINSGQIITSHENLAKQCGLGVQQIRTALNKLKSTGEITSQSTNNYTLITITKWKNYQDDNKPDNNPITNEQQTDNKRITTTKEGKKERIEESIDIAHKAQKQTIKRKTRISEDWKLPQEWGEWAEAQGLTGEEILKEAEKFRDRQISQGAAYLNWQATWRNWIRNHIEWSNKNANTLHTKNK